MLNKKLKISLSTEEKKKDRESERQAVAGSSCNNHTISQIESDPMKILVLLVLVAATRSIAAAAESGCSQELLDDLFGTVWTTEGFDCGTTEAFLKWNGSVETLPPGVYGGPGVFDSNVLSQPITLTFDSNVTATDGAACVILAEMFADGDTGPRTFVAALPPVSAGYDSTISMVEKLGPSDEIADAYAERFLWDERSYAWIRVSDGIMSLEYMTHADGGDGQAALLITAHLAQRGTDDAVIESYCAQAPPCPDMTGTWVSSPFDILESDSTLSDFPIRSGINNTIDFSFQEGCIIGGLNTWEYVADRQIGMEPILGIVRDDGIITLMELAPGPGVLVSREDLNA